MKHFIFILFLLSSVCLHAEEEPDSIIGYADFCCIYNHTIKTVDLNNKEVMDTAMTILEIGDNIAKYEDYFEYILFENGNHIPTDYHYARENGDPQSYDYATKNTLGLAPKFEVNHISIPLSCAFERRFQPLELK